MNAVHAGTGVELPWDADGLAAGLAASGPAMPWRSPLFATLETALPTSTSQDVAAAAARGRAAQQDWAGTPVQERAEVLLRFHDRVLDRLDQFVDLVQYEAGKARLSAVEEVAHVALSARYYARTAGRRLSSERGAGVFPLLTRIDRHHRPRGLVGIIGPWNYPMTMTVSDGLAALVAGNAVLAKPDSQTPFCTLAAARLLTECGLPDGLWQVVHGPGGEVGPELVEVSDYVCFTGSTTTGRSVAGRCAERLIGCSLELGGKNPLLVLDDAEVASAAAGALRSSFANAGQLCVSTERIYVAEPLYDAFTEAFVSSVEALRLGNSLTFDHDMGGLISSTQIEHVARHVDDARAQGATVLTGGYQRPDLGELFYQPTVLSGVRPGMACFAEETFGPVVSLYSARDDDDAVAQANASPYGLNGSVWTGDARRGRRVAERLECGTVNVNEGFAATFGSLDAPMGGMKLSGLGRRQGREGLARFVEVQAVGTQRGMPIAPSFGMSTQTFVNGVVGVLRVLRRLGRP